MLFVKTAYLGDFEQCVREIVVYIRYPKTLDDSPGALPFRFLACHIQHRVVYSYNIGYRRLDNPLDAIPIETD